MPYSVIDKVRSRYGVNSLRSKHGALLDAELLAAVYVAIIVTLFGAKALTKL